MGYLQVCCLISKYLGFFQIYFCYWSLIYALVRERVLWFQPFWIYWNLINGSANDLSECLHLKGMSIRSIWLIVLYKSSIFLVIFCLIFLLITCTAAEAGVLSTTVSLLLLLLPCRSTNSYFTRASSVSAHAKRFGGSSPVIFTANTGAGYSEPR